MAESLKLVLEIDQTRGLASLNLTQEKLIEVMNYIKSIQQTSQNFPATLPATNAVNLLINELKTLDAAENEASQTIAQFIQMNGMSENQIQQVVSALNTQKSALAVNSAEYKQVSTSLASMNNAVKALGAQQGNAASSSGSLTMAMAQLGYGIGDASMFAVDFRMGLLSIGNNIPVVVNGLMQAANSAKIAGQSFKAELASALMGPSGVLIALNLVIAAVQFFSMRKANDEIDTTAEKARQAARDIRDLQIAITAFDYQNMDKAKDSLADYLKKKQEEINTQNEKVSDIKAWLDLNATKISSKGEPVDNRQSTAYKNKQKELEQESKTLTSLIQVRNDYKKQAEGSISTIETLTKKYNAQNITLAQAKQIVKDLKPGMAEVYKRTLVTQQSSVTLGSKEYKNYSKSIENIDKAIKPEKSSKSKSEEELIASTLGYKDYDKIIKSGSESQAQFNGIIKLLEGKVSDTDKIKKVIDDIKNKVATDLSDSSLSQSEKDNKLGLFTAVQNEALKYSGGFLSALQTQISNNEEQLKYVTSLQDAVKIKKEINSLKKQLDEYNKQIDEQANPDLKVLKTLEFDTKKMKADGKSELEILQYKKEVYTSQLADKQSQAELLKNIEVDIQKTQNDGNKKSADEQSKINENIIELDKQTVLSKIDTKEKKLQAERDYYIRLKAELERQMALILGNTNAEVLARQDLQKRINGVNVELQNNNKEASELVSNQWIEDAKTMAEFVDKSFGQMAGNLSKMAGSFYKIAQDKAKKELSVEKDKRLKTLKSEEEERLSKAHTEAEKTKIKKEYSDKEEALDTEIQERQKKAGLAQFKFQQAMDIAQAISSTAVGVTNALAVQPPWVGIALAATVGAMGAAEVVAIKAQEVQGYKIGGLIPGDEQIIRVNEDGKEYVVNSDSTSKYLPILDSINRGNYMPGNYVDRTLASRSNTGREVNIIPLINEVKNMRKDLKIYGNRNAEIMRQEKNVIVGKMASKAVVSNGDYELKRESL